MFDDLRQGVCRNDTRGAARATIAALVTVVGVLVEVPVMLSLLRFANRTRHWFPAGETGLRAATRQEPG
jgi:hypothetical protein